MADEKRQPAVSNGDKLRAHQSGGSGQAHNFEALSHLLGVSISPQRLSRAPGSQFYQLDKGVYAQIVGVLL